MEKMIAFCGTICNECPAFLATKKDDDKERKEIAELWSEKYNADIQPEDINCFGCLSEGGNIFNNCNVCEVRKCGQEKGVKNCAFCDDYACEKLNPIFGFVPDNKTTLDEIKNTSN